ncbi:hypothetical protein ACWDRB_55620 [Nonomuraea sp. NPDC003707]
MVGLAAGGVRLRIQLPNRRMTWVMYGEMVASNPSYALRRVMGSTSSSRAGLARAPASTRLDTIVKNPRFTSVRIFLVISSSVV